MSHYTVGVLSRECPSYGYICDVLAPYDENLEVRHIISKETIIADEREKVENFRDTTYAQYLKDPEAYIETHKNNQQHIKYITEKFPKKLEWDDDDYYQAGIIYYDEENILPNGDVVSYYNPNSKWDWWDIGGRWADLLETEEHPNGIYQARVRDLTNRYDKEKADRAARKWELIVDGVKPENSEEENIVNNSFYSKEYYLNNYQTKENFVKCTASLSTYALIDIYGEWYSVGEMGWWGISDQTRDAESEWHEVMQRMLDDAVEKDYWITIVDLHI